MARSQLPDFEGDFSPKSSDPGELQTLIAIRETQLGEVVAVRSELEVRVDDLTLRYQESEQARIEAQTQLTALETRLADRDSDIGVITTERDELVLQLREEQTARLQAQADLNALQITLGDRDRDLGAVRGERDQLLQTIATVRAEQEARVIEAVRSALAQAGAEHEVVATALRRERDDLKAKVGELEREASELGEVRSAEPASIAQQFATMIEDLAESEARPGRPFTASLTRMEVEARGVLRVPERPDDPPELLTVAPGKVDPGQLSTIRMEFRIMPRSSAG